ncbi:MAG: hypothetical protein GY784_10655 [Gammaproteobacteria bacterium]|nr:hypothetical protein [Gammaproteobacteria bacterium]
MSSWYTTNAGKFNALSLRERMLLGLVLLVAIPIGWGYLYAQPTMQRLELLQQENQRISRETDSTLAAIGEIRQRIATGAHTTRRQELVQLRHKLEEVEEHLRLKTVELINPEDMFLLMSRMIYKESKLTLLHLKRREVKPAIKPVEGEQGDAGIFRHVLEIKFSGKYADILKYMQSLEALDWQLIWDEVEILSQEHPQLTVGLVISTLSTRKEWLGV